MGAKIRTIHLISNSHFMKILSSHPLFALAEQHGARRAIVAREGVFTYHDLLVASAAASGVLLRGARDLAETRIAFLVPPGLHYVTTQWGIWRAGGVAVPLAVTHPQPELEYVLQNSGARIAVAHPDFETRLEPLARKHGLRFLSTTDLLEPTAADFPAIDLQRRAMIIYTSGTTNKPKGVVTTHHNIVAQITSLISAWGWSPQDYLLNVLPLHHIHGIINALSCALWAGATCELLPEFHPETTWKRFLQGNTTVFMAVPTIYSKLINTWEAASPPEQKAMSEACARMRLMISGSAALPAHVFKKWQVLSGHVLLERYGMTEIGMALSNPLHGERRAGFVGTPLPGVAVRLVAEHGEEVGAGTAGEIQVKGQNVFLEYWDNPAATQQAFRAGWFCTGDIAVIEKGYFRILGRASVDIIKTGGYKVSALEIEEVLRTHPDIVECAVVGIPDAEWGERVGAALVLHPNKQFSLFSLKEWACTRIAVYKIPTVIITVIDLPRNAMGKIIKPEVVRLLQSSDKSSH